jgi:hypothetical protein
MNRWQIEINKLSARKPWALAPWVKPQVCFLNSLFPAYKVITFLNIVFVGGGLRNCPDVVRKYIIAHEYGHIHQLHTLPFLYYIFGFIGIAAGLFFGVESLAVFGLAGSLFAMVVFYFSKPRLDKEIEADVFAVSEIGVDMTIEAAKWMAEKTESSDYPERIARMNRLNMARVQINRLKDLK